MNKKGISNLISLIFTPVGLIIIVVLAILVLSYLKPDPHTMCTEHYEETDNYLKLHNIEVGKRWEQEDKICYKTYDDLLYSNLVNITNEQEYKTLIAKLDLENTKNQRMWDFAERNKLYIFGGIIFILLFLIYMKYKDK